MLSRTEVTKRPVPGSGDLGPGAYDDGNTFGKSTRGYSFGKPKPEKKIVDNRDYGYEPEKEFAQTRHKSPTVRIEKGGVGRFTDTKRGDNAGPGHYSPEKGFGADAKGMGFGKPKPEKRVVDNRDYGYNPEREFAQTKHKSPAARIDKGPADRPDFSK